MRESIPAFPLQWPEGWTRTEPQDRERSRYAISFDRARWELVHELELMGATGIVLSTNIPTRRDGYPYARAKEPRDPGVACYWDIDGKPQVMACDCWQTVRDNLRAIGLSVAALRALQRAGATQITERAFGGFERLPADTYAAKVAEWRARFEADLAPRELYRQAVAEHHPDRGGDPQTMAAINQAYREVCGA